jgi:hypothetical protein
MQTYDIQASLQKDSQVTVSVILENQSSSFLKNMELNVLDSLNTKMARPEGSSVHDGVPVPFQLPPGELHLGLVLGTVSDWGRPVVLGRSQLLLLAPLFPSVPEEVDSNPDFLVPMETADSKASKCLESPGSQRNTVTLSMS